VWHDHPNDIRDLAFNHDGTMLATAFGGIGPKPFVTLWDVRSPDRPVRLGQTPRGYQASSIFAVDFSPDGEILATGSKDNSVALWRIDGSGRPVFQRSYAGAPSDPMVLRFHPRGRMLMSGTLTTSVAYDVTDPSRMRPLPSLPGNNTSAVRSIAFSPDGTTMVMAGGSDTVTVWDVRRPDAPVKIADLADQYAAITAVTFTGDGRHFWTAGADGSIVLWSATDAGHPAEHNWSDERLESTYSIGYGAQTMSVGSRNGRLIWQVAGTGRPEFRSLLPVTGPIATALNRPLLASASQRTVTLWDLSRPGQPVRTADVVSNGVPTISDDGTWLTTKEYNSPALCWNISDPHRPDPRPCPLTAPPPVTLTWDETTRKPTLRSGGRSAELPLHSNLKTNLSETVFSHDHSLLAVNDYGTIRIFDVTDPAHPVERATLIRPTVQLSTPITFSPDDNTLASADYRKGVSFWDLTELREAILHPYERAARLTG
jgi:WD40 repeat protein